MNRKSLTAVAAFVVLGLVALFALRQPQKGEGAADRARPLEKINPAELDTLVITRAGVATTIKRDGDKFSVTSPVAYAGDPANGKSAFEQIEKLDLGDLVTENQARHGEFDLDDAKAIHVVAKNSKGGDKVLADILVGKIVGNGTMVRLAGKDEVWQAGGGLRGAIDHPAAEWRDRSITTFNLSDAAMLTVKTKAGGVAIVKKSSGADDKFDVVTLAPPLRPGETLDNTVPYGALSVLSAWKANDFADGVTPAAAGLDTPEMTFTVTLKNGKSVTAMVGGKKDADTYYVKTGDAPTIFLAKTYNIDRLIKKPIEYKDKTICDIAEADLAEVAVTNGADSFTLVNEGGKWKATKPAKLEVDPGKTPSIGGGFKDWKAAGISEDAPASVGLAKPRATISAKAKKGATCSLKIGDDTKDKQNVYALSSKSPDVFMVPKWSVDRILVKVADLKKK
ncbi:MAG TPA: DUF4340 domain-containing protein [Polyangia bacterium]|nr:DUF4340 domain-containing protein [Polyangia bacterium]